MTICSEAADTVSNSAETLFNYAIDRTGLPPLLENLPPASGVTPAAMEYELQLLKITAVGWSLSYFAADLPDSAALNEAFWQAVQRFARDLSTAASAAAGKTVDYFSVIKDRLEIYINALHHFSDVKDPARVIGPTFAKLCGNEDNPYVTIAGKKVFNSALATVRRYLVSTTAQPKKRFESNTCRRAGVTGPPKPGNP